MTTLTTKDLESLLSELGLKVPIPQFDSTIVPSKPLDIARCYLADILQEIVPCEPIDAYNSIQWANNIDIGDLIVIIPRLKHGVNYEALGLELMQKFPQNPLFLLPIPEGVQLRVFLNPQTFPRLLLPFITDRQDSYGFEGIDGLAESEEVKSAGKKIVVEFSSPNIVDEFHGKHLRGTLIGAQLANLYQTVGWDVTKLNYLGDWGKPIGLLGAGWERFGSAELLEADPVGHLHDIYQKTLELFKPEVKASKELRDKGGNPAEIESQGLFAERNAFFKRMEDGDEKALEFWNHFRDLSIEKYTELYARMGISFDDYSGESQVSPTTMAEVEQILKDKGLSEEMEGASVIDMKKHGAKHGTVVIRDRAGSSTYPLRDLAAVLERYRKYAFDKMLYVVAADTHKTHFLRIFEILELMGMSDLAKKLQHISFSKNSHIPGPADQEQTLTQVLDQAQSAMQKSMDVNPEKATLFNDDAKTSDALGTSALFAHACSVSRRGDLTFDIEKLASFETGTGPDLLTWYTKLSSMKDPEPEVAAVSPEENSQFVQEAVPAPEMAALSLEKSNQIVQEDTLEPEVAATPLPDESGQTVQEETAELEVAAALPLEESSEVVQEDTPGPEAAAVLSPEESNQVVQPEESGQAVQPEESSRAVEPEEGIVELEQNSHVAEPEENVPAVEPEESGQVVRPEESSHVVDPEEVIVESEQSSHVVEPEENAQAVEPEESGQVVEHEESLVEPEQSSHVEPEESSHVAEPEESSHVAEPEESVVEPERSSHVVEPEENGQVIEPEESIVQPEESNQVAEPEATPVLSHEESSQTVEPEESIVQPEESSQVAEPEAAAEPEVAAEPEAAAVLSHEEISQVIEREDSITPPEENIVQPEESIIQPEESSQVAEPEATPVLSHEDNIQAVQPEESSQVIQKEETPESKMAALSLKESSQIFQQEEHANLLRLLAHYPEFVQTSFNANDPTNIFTYLINIAERVSYCVGNGEHIVPTSQTQREILNAARIVIGSGLKVLGITMNRTRDSAIRTRDSGIDFEIGSINS